MILYKLKLYALAINVERGTAILMCVCMLHVCTSQSEQDSLCEPVSKFLYFILTTCLVRNGLIVMKGPQPFEPWILMNVRFRHDGCVLYWICKISNIFGEDQSNIKEMATFLRKSRWQQQPSSIQLNVHFQHNVCILCWVGKIPIKFGENQSISIEIATVLRTSRWRQPPSWLLFASAFFDKTVRSIYDLQHSHQLWIGLIIKKWQKFIEIWDGGNRQLDFW